MVHRSTERYRQLRGENRDLSAADLRNKVVGDGPGANLGNGNNSRPMTWNEFQNANRGKYTKSEMSEAWSRYKQENYLNGGEHYLHRPYIRKEIIDEVNANTRINSKGQIWDEIGEKWVSKDNVELCHRPDFEYWYLRNWAESQGMTQAQFNDYMNNAKFYAWQDIHENRSHVKESKH